MACVRYWHPSCKKKGEHVPAHIKPPSSYYNAILYEYTYEYTCIHVFRYEWVLIRGKSHGIILTLSICQFDSDPRIRSLYDSPHHFRNSPSYGRMTFLRAKDIYSHSNFFERKYGDFNIRLSSAVSRRLCQFYRLHRRKVSLIVPRIKRLNGNPRNGKIEKEQRRRGIR